MNIFIGILVGLFSLIFLITAHEFGHFLAARKNGVKVVEFGICFPPRAIAWVKNPETKKWQKLPRKDWQKPQDGLIFSLNWLPIGGFCQMDGESAEDDRKATFGAASFWQKTKILFAGVAMNWLVAFVILTILAWTGMPTLVENQFKFDSDATTSYDDRFTTPLEINRYTWSAPLVGAVTTVQLTGETFKGVGQLVYNLASGVVKQFSPNETAREEGQESLEEVSESVSGPVGIIGTLFPSFAAAGPTVLAFLVALISISLACMNVIPIPALDGGRWLLIAIYKLRKKPLSKETEEKIVSRAFMVLLALIAIITILDITKLFQ